MFFINKLWHWHRRMKTSKRLFPKDIFVSATFRRGDSKSTEFSYRTFKKIVLVRFIDDNIQKIYSGRLNKIATTWIFDKVAAVKKLNNI